MVKGESNESRTKIKPWPSLSSLLFLIGTKRFLLLKRKLIRFFIKSTYNLLTENDVVFQSKEYRKLNDCLLEQGAINIYNKEDMMHEFLEKPKCRPGKRLVIVFHCEFSSKRAPDM